ncbi:MAG: 50S ribosomal protein L15e [Candidatus Aenigmarchaeota archaeon]|nr:50S ribosomal protein L15e [Candidatus Aenigmarchaeota archaeon]
MVKGLYQHLRMNWKKSKNVMKERTRERLIIWRAETRFVRLNGPTRLDRAKSLGYKAKKGFVIVRTRLLRGGRDRPKYGRKGRKPSKTGLLRYTTEQSLQSVVEKRVARKYPNLEVLNSYWVGEDGRYKWFEVIMVDTSNPEIKSDKKLNWISSPEHTRRVFRGLTPSGKKSRK